jgi:hypothetical protein
MKIIVRARVVVVALALSACATPRWENLKQPDADFQADTAACQREAERAVKMDHLARPTAFAAGCAGCQTQANREMQTAVGAFGIQKRCMAARGWRQAS